MSSYTDQDDLEKLKAWWKSYGGALILGVVLGLGLLFGNKYWNEHRETQRLAASNVYADMLQHAREGRIEPARASATELVEKYDGTPYAGMAALMLARLSVESNDAAAARKHLQWAIDRARDPAVQHAARVRLGRLLLDGGDHAAALALTDVARQAGFEAEYAELRGDILIAQGKHDEAREAYGAALKHMAGESAHRRVVQMKLDDIGGMR